MEYMKFDLKYVHQRHRYPAKHRRVLDLFVISAYEDDIDMSLQQKGLLTHLRYKYLKHIYRSELNIKHEWVRVTDSTKKNQIYVWHEDIDNYHNQVKAK
jgi:hypothetical protein